MYSVIWSAVFGCKSNDDSAAPTDDSAVDTDTSLSPEDTGFPDEPSFTLTVAGAIHDSLVFDEPSCSYPMGSSNLRVFWRNAARDHAYLLDLDLLGTFTGVGEYTGGADGAEVKLQEEAGGGMHDFVTDGGDTVDVSVVGVDSDAKQIWGEYTVSALHGGSGTITVTPQPIPIWCPDFG